jgi:hypothetical protein
MTEAGLLFAAPPPLLAAQPLALGGLPLLLPPVLAREFARPGHLQQAGGERVEPALRALLLAILPGVPHPSQCRQECSLQAIDVVPLLSGARRLLFRPCHRHLTPWAPAAERLGFEGVRIGPALAQGQPGCEESGDWEITPPDQFAGGGFAEK